MRLFVESKIGLWGTHPLLWRGLGRLLVKSKKSLHTQTLGGFFGETEVVVNTLTNNP